MVKRKRKCMEIFFIWWEFMIAIFFLHFNAEKENYLRENISRTENVKFL